MKWEGGCVLGTRKSRGWIWFKYSVWNYQMIIKFISSIHINKRGSKTCAFYMSCFCRGTVWLDGCPFHPGKYRWQQSQSWLEHSLYSHHPCKCCIVLTPVSLKAEGPHPFLQPSLPYCCMAQPSPYPRKAALQDAVILGCMGKYAHGSYTGLGSPVTKLCSQDLYSRCVSSSVV